MAILKKHSVSHGAIISEIALIRLWGVHPIRNFLNPAPTPMPEWPIGSIGNGGKTGFALPQGEACACRVEEQKRGGEPQTQFITAATIASESSVFVHFRLRCASTRRVGGTSRAEMKRGVIAPPGKVSASMPVNKCGLSARSDISSGGHGEFLKLL